MVKGTDFVKNRIDNEQNFRPALETHNRDHVRVIQTREFYSKNGIGLGWVFDLQNYKSVSDNVDVGDRQ